MVKRLPAMQETWVRSLGQEDPLEKEMATHSSILAWRIPWMEEPRGATVHGLAKSRTELSDFTHSLTHIFKRFFQRRYVQSIIISIRHQYHNIFELFLFFFFFHMEPLKSGGIWHRGSQKPPFKYSKAKWDSTGLNLNVQVLNSILFLMINVCVIWHMNDYSWFWSRRQVQVH